MFGVSKGIKNNRLVYVLHSAIGKVFIPHSIPLYLLPFVAADKKAQK